MSLRRFLSFTFVSLFAFGATSMMTGCDKDAGDSAEAAVDKAGDAIEKAADKLD